MAPATVPPQRPSPPALPRVLLALLPLLLGGCSGTPFGEALSRSFPGPSATPAATATPSPGDVQTTRQGDAQSTPASPSAGSAGTAGAQSGPVAGAGAGPVAAPAAATSAAIPKSGGSNTSGTGPAVSAAGAIPAVAPRPAAKAPANPAPYRVTIRLPQADPSAPAEVVTEALRAAGVPFEVETIERMGAGTTAAPAVAPVVPAVPQVRPAPSPR